MTFIYKKKTKMHSLKNISFRNIKHKNLQSTSKQNFSFKEKKYESLLLWEDFLTDKKKVSSSDSILKMRNGVLAKANKSFYLKESFFLRQLKQKTLFFYSIIQNKNQYQRITWVTNHSKLFTNYLFFKAREKKQLFIGGVRINSRLWLPGLLTNYKSLEKIRRSGWADPLWTMKKLDSKTSENIPLDGYPVASSNLFTPRKPSMLLTWTSKIATHEVLTSPNAKISFVSPWNKNNVQAAKKKIDHFNDSLMLIEQNKILSSWLFNFIDTIVENRKKKLNFLSKLISLKFSFIQNSKIKKHLIKFKKTNVTNNINNYSWQKNNARKNRFDLNSLVLLYKKYFFKLYRLKFKKNKIPKIFLTYFSLNYLKKKKDLFKFLIKDKKKKEKDNTVKKYIQSMLIKCSKKKKIVLNMGNSFKKNINQPSIDEEKNKFEKIFVPNLFTPTKEKIIFKNKTVLLPSFEKSLKKLKKFRQTTNKKFKNINSKNFSRSFSTVIAFKTLFKKNAQNSFSFDVSKKNNLVKSTNLFWAVKKKKLPLQLPLLKSTFYSEQTPIQAAKSHDFLFLLNRKKKQQLIITKQFHSTFYKYLKNKIHSKNPIKPINKNFLKVLFFRTGFNNNDFFFSGKKVNLASNKASLINIRSFLGNSKTLINKKIKKKVFKTQIKNNSLISNENLTLLDLKNKKINLSVKTLEKKFFLDPQIGFSNFLKNNFLFFIYNTTQQKLGFNKQSKVKKLLLKKKIWIKLFKNVFMKNNVKIVDKKIIRNKIDKNTPRIKNRNFYFLSNYRKKKKKRLFNRAAKLRQYFSRRWRQRLEKKDFFTVYSKFFPLQSSSKKIAHLNHSARIGYRKITNLNNLLEKKICVSSPIKLKNYDKLILLNKRYFLAFFQKFYLNKYAFEISKKAKINTLLKFFKNVYKENQNLLISRSDVFIKHKKNLLNTFLLKKLLKVKTEKRYKRRRPWYKSGYWKIHFRLTTKSKLRKNKDRQKTKKVQKNKKLKSLLLKKNKNYLKNLYFKKFYFEKKKTNFVNNLNSYHLPKMKTITKKRNLGLIFKESALLTPRHKKIKHFLRKKKRKIV